LLLWSGIALAGSPAAAAPDSPALLSAPTATEHQLPPGITPIGDHAFAYVPAGSGGPRPLVLLLHGAGQKASVFLAEFTPFADRFGFVILAPQSTDGTWDFAERRHFGPDVARIDAALGQLFRRTPIRADRIIVAGFSDGASYALSLGLANRRLFRGVMSLSAGFLTERPPYEPELVFVAHGTRDRVLPYTYALEDLVPKLQAGGARVRLRSFNGRHEIDPASVEEGLKFTLGIKPSRG
jgi:phospholipase/carboxylesterase